MFRERRQHVRHRVTLECSWTRDARATDISPGGCFVASGFVPRAGDEIEFSITFDQQPVRVRGTVVNVRPGQGFGFVFNKLSEEARTSLQALLANISRRDDPVR